MIWIWVTLGVIHIWGIYQIVKIFHYEGHKYDKLYIQQKYEEGLMKAKQIKLKAEEKRTKQAERLNRRINLLHSTNLKLHIIMRNLINKYQYSQVQYFRHEYDKQTLKLQKNMISYQKFVGDRSKDLAIDLPLELPQTP